MKIELVEEEIKAAIIAYVGDQGFSIDAEKADVDLKAGRGEHGMTATISMNQGKLEVAIDSAPDGNVTDMPEPADGKKLKFGNDK